MGDEFYTRPILCVRDVGASMTYYCEKLGFAKKWDFPADKPIIAQVGRNGLDIILDSESTIPRASVPSVLSMSLHKPEKLWALYRELKDRGAKDLRRSLRGRLGKGLVSARCRGSRWKRPGRVCGGAGLGQRGPDSNGNAHGCATAADPFFTRLTCRVESPKDGASCPVGL